MSRKNAAARKEPITLPDVLIPPSQVENKDREAYWLSLLAEPDNLKAAVQTEDFWPMLRDFPDALWTSNRLSLYLYRRPDDEGLHIKNAEGKKGYIKIFHQPLDEEHISRTYGGGKYTVFLKLDHKLTLTEFTFTIDGVPKVMPGQVVEIAGKEVPVSGVVLAPTTQTDIAKVIDASAEANAKSQEMLTHAAKTSIDMVREQAAANVQPPHENTLDTAVKLIALLQPKPDPIMQEFMRIMMTKAMADPKPAEPAPVAERETPIETTLSAIETLSGGKSLAELMKPAFRAEAENPVTVWAPIVQTVGGVIEKIFDRLPTINAQRIQILILEERRRKLEKGEPIENLPALPALPTQQQPPQPAHAVAPNGPPDPAQLMQALVREVIHGFKKPPTGEYGEDCAAHISFVYSEAIESVQGLPNTLADPVELHKVILGIPDFAPFVKDGRWARFEHDLAITFVNRWCMDDEMREQRLAALDSEAPPQSAA